MEFEGKGFFYLDEIFFWRHTKFFQKFFFPSSVSPIPLCCQLQGPRQISVHTQKKTPHPEFFLHITHSIVLPSPSRWTSICTHTKNPTPHPTPPWRKQICVCSSLFIQALQKFVSACVMLQICAFTNHAFINILTTLAPLSFTGAQSLWCRSQVPFCDSTTSLLLSLLQSVKHGVMKLQGHPHY